MSKTQSTNAQPITQAESLKPRHIARALPSISARRAGDWLRGERSPDVTELARLIGAFPEIDAAQLVAMFARRRADRAAS